MPLLKSQLLALAGPEPNDSHHDIAEEQRDEPEIAQQEERDDPPDEPEIERPEIEPEDSLKPKVVQFYPKGDKIVEEIRDGKKVMIWKVPKNRADVILAEKLGAIYEEDEIRDLKDRIGQLHRRGVGDILKPKQPHLFDKNEMEENRPPRHVLPDVMLPHSCWLPGNFRRTIRNNFRRAPVVELQAWSLVWLIPTGVKAILMLPLGKK